MTKPLPDVPAAADDPATISLSHASLRFTCRAAGDTGPIVICLHGFPDDASTFRHQERGLADAGFRVRVPTMRGYEPSSIPADHDYRIGTLAGDLFAWIDELGGEPVHVVGHDWGAAVGYAAAAMQPERLLSLTAVAVPHPARFLGGGLRAVPSQALKSWYMLFFQARGLADNLVSMNDWALVRRLWRRWAPGYALPDDDWVELRSTFEQPGVRRAMLDYYRCNTPVGALLGHGPGGMSALTTIPVRTLAVTGGDDGCIDTRLFDHAMRPADFPAGLRVERIDDAGHFVHREQPAEFNRVLIEWLREAAG